MSDEIAEQLQGLGPAMQALAAKQRLYVLAMLSDPFGTPTKWAAAAGYATTSDAHRTRGFENAHNPAIQAAVDEVARQHLGTMGPVLGLAVTMRIARNPKHPKQLKAAEMLLNRVGLHEKTEHLVNVAHSVNPEAVIERIRKAAAALGVDPATLLGANTPAPPMKVIDGTVEKVDELRVDRADG